jgi:hypothetical protein
MTHFDQAVVEAHAQLERARAMVDRDRTETPRSALYSLESSGAAALLAWQLEGDLTVDIQNVEKYVAMRKLVAAICAGYATRMLDAANDEAAFKEVELSYRRQIEQLFSEKNWLDRFADKHGWVGDTMMSLAHDALRYLDQVQFRKILGNAFDLYREVNPRGRGW